jgi:hypothetical protein
MKKLLTFKKSSIANVIMAMISIFVLSTYDSSSQTSVDFSGTWKLDLSKSTTLPDIVSLTLIITQKGNDITINRTMVTKDTKPIIGTFNYSIGTKNESKSNSVTNITTSSWGTDKHTFSIIDTFVTEKNGVKQEWNRKSVYSLTDNGKTLIVVSDDTLPEGAITPENQKHMKMIYAKS